MIDFFILLRFHFNTASELMFKENKLNVKKSSIFSVQRWVSGIIPISRRNYIKQSFITGSFDASSSLKMQITFIPIFPFSPFQLILSLQNAFKIMFSKLYCFTVMLSKPEDGCCLSDLNSLNTVDTYIIISSFCYWISALNPLNWQHLGVSFSSVQNWSRTRGGFLCNAYEHKKCGSTKPNLALVQMGSH